MSPLHVMFPGFVAKSVQHGMVHDLEIASYSGSGFTLVSHPQWLHIHPGRALLYAPTD